MAKGNGHWAMSRDLLERRNFIDFLLTYYSGDFPRGSIFKLTILKNKLN